MGMNYVQITKGVDTERPKQLFLRFDSQNLVSFC